MWWGPRRHIALRDWYPQQLQDKGWYLLVIPTIPFPDLVFPVLSPALIEPDQAGSRQPVALDGRRDGAYNNTAC
jgi:hypothetical protein